MRNIARDAIGATLLLFAVFLPWNIHLGVGVPNASTWFIGVVVATSVLSLGSLAVRSKPVIRVALNAPYLLLVAAIVVFTIFEAVRYGGTGDVPAGVGPGAIVGLSGALLIAQPRPTVNRVLGLIAMALGIFAFLFNLYWRTRYVIPGFGDVDYGKQNVVVAFTALVYGFMALAVVLVGLRLVVSRQLPAMLATFALGTATVLGTALVWIVPGGRDIDAFHGIAQNTSTAGVGFEGYLVWAAAGAIVGPLALRQALSRPRDRMIWQVAVQKCLTLIAVYCVGSGLLRIVDMVTAAILDLPFSAFDGIALLAFDIVAAAVTVWLSFNVKNPALHPVVISAVCGVLAILTICRVVVGVGLAPRILYVEPPEGLASAVYGNTLAQQITSTFDVVLCWLALAVLVIAIFVLQRDGLQRLVRPAKPLPANAGADAATSVVGGGRPPVEDTQKWAPRAPRIARPSENTRRIRIATPDSAATTKLPNDAPATTQIDPSTQRFPTGPNPRNAP